MSDTIALLRTRRSVAPIALGGPAPSPGDLETMLTVATRVPDHGKLAPWRFIVFEGRARERAGEVIAAVFAADNPDVDAERVALERKRLAHAPLVVAVVSQAAPHIKIPEWEQVLSAAAVCMSFLIAANALGYAATWITEWYAYDRRVLDGLGIAGNEKIAGFIHIGRSTVRPDDRVRPALADVVTYFSG